MFNDVLFLAIIVVAGLVMLLYPLGVALATARAAERIVKARGGGRIDHIIAAVTSIAAVMGLFIAAPLVGFIASVPLLVLLLVLDKRSRWTGLADELPIATARRLQ